MKYTLNGFHQGMLMLFRKEVEVDGKKQIISLAREDLDILSWLIDIWFSENRRSFVKHINHEDGLEYINVHYDAVLDEFPFIFNTKRTVYRSFQRLTTLELIKHYTHIEKNKGKYSCYRPNEEVISLILFKNRIPKEGEIEENIKTICQICHTLMPKMADPCDKNVCSKYPLTIYPLTTSLSSKEDIWNSDEFHNKPSSIKEKQTTSSDQKEYFPHPFLEYWNSKPNLRTHKVTSKDYQNAAGMFNMLQNGVFGNLYRIEHEYAQTNKIKPETMRKVFTEDEIKAVIDKFDLMCSSDYVSKIKDGYPKSCSAFLWNPKTNRSFFMALYSSDNDIKPIKEAPMRQDVIDYYKDSLRLRNLNESEEADLVRSVNFIERRKVEYEKKMNQYGGCPYRLSGGNFYKTHLEWVRIKLQDTGKFELWKIANKFSWSDFVKWVKNNYGSECDMEIEIKDVKIMEECYN